MIVISDVLMIEKESEMSVNDGLECDDIYEEVWKYNQSCLKECVVRWVRVMQRQVGLGRLRKDQFRLGRATSRRAAESRLYKRLELAFMLSGNY